MAMALTKKQSGGSSRGRMPSRRAINFAETEKQKANYTVLIPVVLVAVLLIGVIVKFAFLDRLDAVKEQQQITADRQQELDLLNAKVASYSELALEYAHFTYSGMSEEEKTRSDRVDILNLIEKEIRKRVTVKSWTINGNVVTIYVNAKDKLSVQTVKQIVEQSPLVSGCSMPKLQQTSKVEDGVQVITTNATLKILFNPKVRIKPVVKEEATNNEG